MKFEYNPRNQGKYLMILAFYQIVGGGIGIYMTYNLFKNVSQISIILISLYLLAFLLYLFSILCGLLLFSKDQQYFKYSLLNQYLQLISFAVGGYSFMYISGVYLTLGINYMSFIEFKLFVGTSIWQFSFNTGFKLLSINLNVVALILIILLKRIRKREDLYLFTSLEDG